MHPPSGPDEKDAMDPATRLRRPLPDFLPREFVLEFKGDPNEKETRLFRGIRKLKALGYEVKQRTHEDTTVLTVKQARPPRQPFRRLGGKA